PGSPQVMTALINMMSLSLRKGEFDETRALLEEAEGVARGLVGAEWYAGWVQYIEAKVLLGEGDAAGAAEEARGALQILESELPKGDWRIAVARSVLGEAVGILGRQDEAERLLVGALADLRSATGETS